MNTTTFLGFLAWFTVPECAAPYADLNRLASQVGFPLDCVPTPPAARHAWEKATNVGGTRGLKLDVPVDLRNQVFIQYSADPVVRLITRRVSDAAPVLRRHLVREAVVPTSPDHWKQLSMQTVAVLEFDCATQQADVQLVYDSEGWTNGNLNSIVADIQTRQRALLKLADGNDIREGVRKLLYTLHRINLRGTGGVYFVPQAAPDADQSLRALRAYIRGLAAWKTGQLEPSCNVVKLHGEDAAELREEIVTSAVAEFKARLSDLAERVEPILKGTIHGKVADKVSQLATEELMQVKSALAAYQSSLQDDFAALSDMLDMAQAAVLQAMGMADEQGAT
jgi:hypothetical protein